LHGRFYWSKRTIEDVHKSIEYYEQAIAQDPNYAPAHAGLADAYALLGSSPNDALPPNEAMPKAKAAAEKALQLDDGLAEAHASLAYVSMVYDWDWSTAEKEFHRAIDLNPNYATAHEWYAELLAARSPFSCASSTSISWERIASRRDRPSHPIWRMIRQLRNLGYRIELPNPQASQAQA